VSAASLQRRLDNLTDVVPYDAVLEGGIAVADFAAEEAARSITGSGRLKGGRVKLYADTTTVEVTATGARNEVYGVPKGLWTWIERPNTPGAHRIPLDRNPYGPMPIKIGRAEAPYASGPVKHPGVSKPSWSGAWERVIEFGDAEFVGLVLSEIQEKVTY